MTSEGANLFLAIRSGGVCDSGLLLALQHIEVARLMKSKPLDNMEFMQWMKSYVDGQTGALPIDGYDGAARRAGSRTGDIRSGAPGRRRPVPPPARCPG